MSVYDGYGFYFDIRNGLVAEAGINETLSDCSYLTQIGLNDSPYPCWLSPAEFVAAAEPAPVLAPSAFALLPIGLLASKLLRQRRGQSAKTPLGKLHFY
jgi:hypothetical protein